MSNLFRVKNGLNLSPVDLATLTSPQAGDLACDINDSNKIKRYDANTLGWTEVGSGGVGNVNALLTQTFDTAALAQFTQTGLALSTSNPIGGIQSARLIHQPATSQSFKQVIAVDRKYRGELMNLSLQVRSSATSGNLTLLVTDETNSAVIMASSSVSTSQYQVATAVTNTTTTISGFSNVDINTLKVGMTITGAGIPTATVINSINTATNTIVISQAATASATITAKFSALPDRRTFSFTIPTNCASLSYTVTALQEAGLPESYVDDVVIELANVSLLETSVTVPKMTAWSAYIPTFTGFGTATNIEFEWRQNGENVDIRGKFASGPSTAVEARVSLPNGYTSAGTGLIPSIQQAGNGVFDAATAAQAIILIEPSVTYFTMGLQTSGIGGLSKSAGSTIMVSTQRLSLIASIPILGLSATEDVVIPLTQSGIVQEADGNLQINAFLPANGSTNTCIMTIASGTIAKSIGDHITWVSSATLGDTFTAKKNGVYTFNYTSDSGTVAKAVGFSKNSTQLTTAINSITAADKLNLGFDSGSNGVGLASWTGALVVGDVVRIHNDTGAFTSASTQYSAFSCTYQGALKQVSVNTNSKITIPTSELRFEGASARGAVATGIVKFDTLAKIRGDAFTVTNTANDGTFITMTKAGKLDINVNLFAAASRNILISKNQAILTITPTASEIMSSAYTTGIADVLSTTYSGSVVVGDVFRICSTGAPTADIQNSLNLLFQEQDIQVSVSNTLPQFSDSDSSVRLDTANVYGTINTTTRRFSNVIQNLGNDIEYVDSITLGGQFKAKTAGIYHLSYSEASTSNAARSSVVLTVNGYQVSRDADIYNTATTGVKSASCSWSGYLNANDIVQAEVFTAAENNGIQAIFTMSKVGKPNVTGVDVTPFVNVPQPVSQSIYLINTTSTINTTVVGALTSNTGQSVLSYNSSTGIYTALKSCDISASFTARTSANTPTRPLIYVDANAMSIATSVATTNANVTTSWNGKLQAGQTISFQIDTTASINNIISIVATALSDQILTAPETFSSDTAALTYAGSGTYTLATLANAPVGTFITYTVAINSNTLTQTTTAPTQTTSDMNTNGILITARGYNAASTAASPAVIAIQIGKGIKGVSTTAYNATGKSDQGNLDFYNYLANVRDVGPICNAYEESTGILYIDFGTTSSTSVTAHFMSSFRSGYSGDGYLVINASKNPALTGLGLGTVAARGVNTAGTSIANTGVTVIPYDAAKTYDTHGALSAATGIFTCPESGYYQASGSIYFTGSTNAIGNQCLLYLYKNGVSYAFGGLNTADRAALIEFTCSIASGVYLVKGDTLELRASHNRTAGATTIITAAGANYFSIQKVSI